MTFRDIWGDFSKTSNFYWVFGDYHVAQSFVVPTDSGAFIGSHNLTNLLPRIVVDVAVAEIGRAHV